MTPVIFPITATALKALLKERGIRPRKHLGQNFLIDQNILRLIVEEAAVENKDIILEVGSGTGLLTRLLVERAHRVLAVEIDPRLYGLTRELFQGCDNVHFLNSDILHTKSTINPEVEALLARWLSEKEGLRLKVVSNLPYSISTPFIIAILLGKLPVALMVLTLQRDIVDRLLAPPSTREYGVLSVMAQLFSEVKLLRALPPGVFWPAPEVESAIVKIDVRREQVLHRIPDPLLFNHLVRTIFQSRRKTLLNSLLKLHLPSLNREVILDIISRLGLQPQIRGEALDPDSFITLSREIGIIPLRPG